MKQEKLIRGLLAALQAFADEYSKVEKKSEMGKAAMGVLKYGGPCAKAFLEEVSKPDTTPPSTQDENTNPPLPEPEKIVMEDGNRTADKDRKTDR